MGALVLDDLLRLAEVGAHPQELAVREIDEARVRTAEACGDLHDLVEDSLEPEPGTAEGVEHVDDRRVPAAELPELAGQLVAARHLRHVRPGDLGR